MWSGCETNAPFKGFSTPPAAWRRTPNSPVAAAGLPMSESRRRERIMPPVGGGCRRDLFHVMHKVPSGDSPYVKAKHAQLLEKDPNKAVALFWAAINAGDRVDSALKDMAIVMKQLDRSDEAIEAIKSFRYLCHYDSQESLDNILVELYKRSGRMEEEIVMLQQKLKSIEDDIAFGGKRTKTARSQGKKVQITVEQERSRILGNLAWVYLQQHNYGLAEQHYRKAISFEPDKNKQCNLALCLMHMNRIQEAQTLLEEVRRASGGIEQMDDSYAKSYERASQMLTKLESAAAAARSEEQDGQEKGSLSSPANQKTKEVTSSTSEAHDCTKNPRNWTDGRREETVILGEQYEGSCWQNKSDNMGNFVECYNDRMISHGLRGEMQSSSQSAFVGDWRRDPYSESPGAQSQLGDHWNSTPGAQSARRQTNASPAPILFTQPKRDSWSSNANNASRALYTQPRADSWRSNAGEQRRGTFGEDAVPNPSDNFLSHTIRNLSGELDSTDEKMEIEPQKSVSSLPSPGGRGWGRSWKDVGRSDSQQTNWKREDQRDGIRRKPSTEDGNAFSAPVDSAAIVDRAGVLEASTDNKQESSFGLTLSCTDKSTESARDSFWENSSSNYASKSWADIVEQEEQELSNREQMNQNDLAKESNDENLDWNNIQKLKEFNLADSEGTSKAAVTSRNWAVRRSLPFGPKKETDTKKRNRLQVFRDITPFPDSP